MTTLLGIAGSLRRASRSAALLEVAKQLTPEGVTLLGHPLRDVPLYNGDDDLDGGPPAVRALKEAIARADGVVFVSPEYNHSFSGVLKNAIDWASRPAYGSGFLHKPVAVIGVATSEVGGARGTAHLRQVLMGLGSEVFPAPDMLVGQVHEKLAADGALVDEQLRTRLERMLRQFSSWAARRSVWRDEA